MPGFAPVSGWSETPSENAANLGIPLYEGMPPSELNDAIRTVMAAIRGFYNQVFAPVDGEDVDQHVKIDLSNLDVDALTALLGLESGSATSGFEVGDVKPSFRYVASSGWLMLDGSTIGSATSGAANASADYELLFESLWGAYDNSVLALQDSFGTPVVRGATAAADWAAAKRMPLFDLRGKFLRGWDTGAGIDAGRVLGSSQVDAFQGHRHSTIVIDGNPGATVNAGGGFLTITSTGDPVTDGVHGAPRTAAETRPYNVACNWFIKI